MLRKVVLTGLLLFTSERPMVRAVLATLVCCLMIINLNFFQPHRNLIVFWVEQLANLSATVKYLFAVVIAGGGGDVDGGNGKLGYDDMRTMGYLLIASDVACLAISLFAIIGCIVLLHRSIVDIKKQDAENNARVQKDGSSLNENLSKRLSMTSVQPQAHRRSSSRMENPASHGLVAIMTHANDHTKFKSGTKKTSKFNFKKITELVRQGEHVAKKTEEEHDASLERVKQELAKKSEAGHSRLQHRLKKRNTLRNQAGVSAELVLPSQNSKPEVGAKGGGAKGSAKVGANREPEPGEKRTAKRSADDGVKPEAQAKGSSTEPGAGANASAKPKGSIDVAKPNVRAKVSAMVKPETGAKELNFSR
jgi:hypothetical protein